MKDEKKPTILGLKKELDEFKNEILDILKGSLGGGGRITTSFSDYLLNSNDGGEQETVTPKVQSTLPENYQAIFEEYFDPTDGFEAEMSYEGNISFTIIVPMKFSNTTEAWRTYYKVDRRTKVLKQGNIEGGIAEWCEKVKKNLHYDKNLVKK